MSNMLVVGGSDDPNIIALLKALEKREHPYVKLLVGENAHPSLFWDMQADQLLLNNHILEADSAFIRYDIFTYLNTNQAGASQRAYSWYITLMGWTLAHEKIRLFNRFSGFKPTNKTLNLFLAKQCGLATPTTYISNNLEELGKTIEEKNAIVKPVNDGGFCEPLDEVLQVCPTIDGLTASPAFVQAKLVPPEVRVYRIGHTWHGFQVVSKAIDYRTDQNVQLVPLTEVNSEILLGLSKLSEMLGLDFAAADFKTCPETGNLLFLEINSAPMFVAFDNATGGKLIDAVIDLLA